MKSFMITITLLSFLSACAIQDKNFITHKDNSREIASTRFNKKKAKTIKFNKRLQKNIGRSHFFDDFIWKSTNSEKDNYCYDELPPQCSEWNSSSYNC